MSVSRRGFVRTVGAGTVGAFSSSFVIGRGREAWASSPDEQQQVWDDGNIRISSNENARGPGPSAIQALHNTISPRAGRGYPPDHTNALLDVLAEAHGVPRENVLVATGSGPILAGAVYAFCSPQRGLVTAAPTYATSESTARRLGFPVSAIRVDASLSLDLDAMADAARSAGLVFLCNPNNPTGLAHPLSDVEAFVRLVKERTPEIAVLIDEAYLDYAHDGSVRTARALGQELPGVFITRSLSKAHGMAGLRVGYAVGQAETLRKISQAWHLGSMNTLSAAAAIASIQDRAHIADEVAENARIRSFVVAGFRELGYDMPVPHANFVLVELGRPASWFREQCAERKVIVGRDFPPLEQTHSRISLGTMAEMQRAMQVFRDVLRA
ncbi:MAG: histidinol-phosphate transaminase [Gemmatimonadota bacterium]